ncbi:MAG TPA: hypothetical protein VIH71_01620 [Solirubrobacteraceae bacterium]
MLFVILAIALVAAVTLGMSMCRLAALSDRKQAGALADWNTRSYAIEREPWSVEGSPGELPFDAQGEAFRAAG